MDEHLLPENPQDWPTDPFALLGVSRTVGETDLKRAYTRLIRKYKPEHAPEEFRRIREAYERAIEMSRWFRDSPVHDSSYHPPFEPLRTSVPVNPPPPAPQDVSPSEPGADVPHRVVIDAPVHPAPVDPVEDAWADAVAGNWSEAYASLVALAGAHPERAELPLRLYWLLALRPALDAERSRHDWLVAGLRRAKLSGPAVELYARELAADPVSALYPPYMDLLESTGVPGPRLLALARLRLAAASRVQRWVAVELDLAVLTHRADELDEELWLGYLADVSGRAAYAQTPLSAQCEAVLAGLKHLELRHGWAFDRLDEQRASVRLWREATMVPDPIRQAVAVAWSGGDWQQPLAHATAWAAADPLGALRRCDQATREGLTVLSAFSRMLANRRSQEENPSEYPPELIRGLFRVYLTNNTRGEYGLMRESLLLFLLAERIDPDELVAACTVDPAHRGRSIVTLVREDGILHLVYRAASGLR